MHKEFISWFAEKKKLKNFRVWVEPSKTMYYHPTAIHFDGASKSYEISIELNPSLILRYRADDCVLMESLGIKDSYGYLLYERDVVYIEGGAEHQGLYEMQDTILVKEKTETILTLLTFAASTVRRKGNIYQNPDIYHNPKSKWLQVKGDI